MNVSRRFFSCAALSTIALGITLLFTASAAAATKKPDPDNASPPVPDVPPTSEATFDLRYKLSRGDVLRYNVTDKRSIIGTDEHTTQSAQSKTESVKVWKVTDVLPEGEIEFINLVERVHMVNQLPDEKSAEYDSDRDKTPPPGFEDAAQRVGVPLSLIRITAGGKVVSRQPKVRGKGADEDAPIVLRLPDKPVAIGDTWDEPFDVKVDLQQGASKMVQTRWHHKLLDVKDGIATIEVTYQILTPIDASVELQVVQRMMNGKVQFDIAKGRIVARQMGVDKRILGFAGPTSS
ncbi:MAG TPA: hypothetical protein VHE81_20590, partial [Lacipirellulaceae bacterium]|nr:hypothetical protein [Lacipirellulaceae bacterium]